MFTSRQDSFSNSRVSEMESCEVRMARELSSTYLAPLRRMIALVEARQLHSVLTPGEEQQARADLALMRKLVLVLSGPVRQR